MPIQIDLVPLVVGLITALGGGVGIKTLIDGLLKIRAGMSAKESKRAVDIVTQRDAAIAREERAWRITDEEAKKRREVQEWAAKLQRRLIIAGLDSDLPPEPEFENTITRAQLKQLREEE